MISRLLTLAMVAVSAQAKLAETTPNPVVFKGHTLKKKAPMKVANQNLRAGKNIPAGAKLIPGAKTPNNKNKMQKPASKGNMLLAVPNPPMLPKAAKNTMRMPTMKWLGAQFRKNRQYLEKYKKSFPIMEKVIPVVEKVAEAIEFAYKANDWWKSAPWNQPSDKSYLTAQEEKEAAHEEKKKALSDKQRSSWKSWFPGQ